ncbi:MAG: stage III sporulation protein AG [Lachnospiraceae bacterium]|nr:stage III sporulation protein AG [Lachnospiraceae bacterium]
MKREPETWKEFLGKKQNRLILLAVCGVFFLLLSWPQGEEASESSGEETVEAAAAASSSEAYVEMLERRLEEILSSMEGVGEVSVMITLASSSEQILQEDEEAEEEISAESDSDSSRSETSSRRSSSTFTDGDDMPYVVKEVMPAIEGVVVTAEGASSATVCREIKEAVQALFDVEAHKIKVLKRES